MKFAETTTKEERKHRHWQCQGNQEKHHCEVLKCFANNKDNLVEFTTAWKIVMTFESTLVISISVTEIQMVIANLKRGKNLIYSRRVSWIRQWCSHFLFRRVVPEEYWGVTRSPLGNSRCLLGLSTALPDCHTLFTYYLSLVIISHNLPKHLSPILPLVS